LRPGGAAKGAQRRRRGVDGARHLGREEVDELPLVGVEVRLVGGDPRLPGDAVALQLVVDQRAPLGDPLQAQRRPLLGGGEGALEGAHRVRPGGEHGEPLAVPGHHRHAVGGPEVAELLRRAS
jgi:hypothetical protein